MFVCMSMLFVIRPISLFSNLLYISVINAVKEGMLVAKSTDEVDFDRAGCIKKDWYMRPKNTG